MAVVADAEVSQLADHMNGQSGSSTNRSTTASNISFCALVTPARCRRP
jgi:hypothetical protein